MYQTNVIQFEVNVESTLSKSVSFTRRDPEKLAEALLNTFELQGLTADDFVVRRHDALYNYEVRFALFRGNANFAIGAKSVRVTFINGRFQADLTTITDVLVRFYACLDLPEGTMHNIRSTTQFKFAVPEKHDEYFSAQGSRWESFPATGFIAFVETKNEKSPVRVSAEPSLAFPGGGFLVVSTQVYEAGIKAESLAEVIDAFSQAVAKCQLEFIISPP